MVEHHQAGVGYRGGYGLMIKGAWQPKVAGIELESGWHHDASVHVARKAIVEDSIASETTNLW